MNVDSHPVPSPSTVGRVVSGELVVVNFEDAKIKVLNETGTRVWTLADGSRSVAEIAAVLSAEFDVDLATAQADALAFLATLKAKGLIGVAPAGGCLR